MRFHGLIHYWLTEWANVSILVNNHDRVCFLQYLTNAALARTTLVNTTLLSSTSGPFTLLIGACLGQDSIDVAQVIAVIVSMAGFAMTTLGKNSSTDELQLSTLKYTYFPFILVRDQII